MTFFFFFSERGVVWEETIILLPDNVHYVFLSATIPNARQFAEWICHLHKQVTFLRQYTFILVILWMYEPLFSHNVTAYELQYLCTFSLCICMDFWFCVGTLKLFVLMDIFSSYLNTSLVSTNTLNYETLTELWFSESGLFSTSETLKGLRLQSINTILISVSRKINFSFTICIKIGVYLSVGKRQHGRYSSSFFISSQL